MAGTRSVRAGVGPTRADQVTTGARGEGPGWARGRTRLALIRDLAMGEWDPKTLADHLGVKAADIRAFADAHATEIAEVSAALAGKLAIETAGHWITKRQNRIAEMQSDFEDYDAVLVHLREKGVADGSGLGSRRHATTTRARLALLGAVADELEPRRGQPTLQDGTKPTRYIIEGLDPKNLL